MDEMVTIPKKEYLSLIDDSAKLQALEDGGVDNWEWYSESLEPYWEAKKASKDKAD